LESFEGSSLNSKAGQVAGYACRSADASWVYAALPVAVGLLVTSFLSMTIRGASQVGLRGRVYISLVNWIDSNCKVKQLASSSNLGSRFPTKLIKVTASVSSKVVTNDGINFSILSRTV
jgi:hypothetical protein